MSYNIYNDGGGDDEGFMANQDNFFVNTEALLNDDEELNDNLNEYDDDKNDETFGALESDVGWEQEEYSNLSQKFQQILKSEKPSTSFDTNEEEDDHHAMESRLDDMIGFAIDDEGESRQQQQQLDFFGHHQQQNQPSLPFYQSMPPQHLQHTPQMMNQFGVTMGAPPQILQKPPQQQFQQPPVTPQKEEVSETEEGRPRSSSLTSPNRRFYNMIYNTYNPRQADSTYNQINRRLFQDTKLMSSEEIESIVRQQMQDLQIKNPFVDDFYYCSLTNKSSIEARRINSNFANWVLEGLSIYHPKSGKTEEELKREEQLSQQPRVFGRIPSQNVRAPRELFELDQELKDLQNSPYSMSTIRRDAMANLNCLIENGLLFLLQIQDFALCMRNIQSSMNPAAVHEFFGLCQLVTRLLNLPTQQQMGFTFYQILEKRKGIKFVSKALQHLPEPFSVHLLKNVILSWDVIMYNFIAKQEDAEELKANLIKDSQTGISNLSLVGICQLIHDGPTQDAIIKMNYPQFFAQGGLSVLATLLQRANELIPSDPQNAGAWRSDFAELFKSLHVYKFAKIAGNDRESWRLLEQLLLQCDDNQRKILIEDLKPYLTQNPTPNMTGFLRSMTIRNQFN